MKYAIRASFGAIVAAGTGVWVGAVVRCGARPDDDMVNVATFPGNVLGPTVDVRQGELDLHGRVTGTVARSMPAPAFVVEDSGPAGPKAVRQGSSIGPAAVRGWSARSPWVTGTEWPAEAIPQAGRQEVLR